MSGRKSFLLRLDPALWVELESLAAQELRSVNGEIEALLREALALRGRKLPPAEPRRRGRPPAGSVGALGEAAPPEGEAPGGGPEGESQP